MAMMIMMTRHAKRWLVSRRLSDPSRRFLYVPLTGVFDYCSTGGEVRPYEEIDFKKDAPSGVAATNGKSDDSLNVRSCD